MGAMKQAVEFAELWAIGHLTDDEMVTEVLRDSDPITRGNMGRLYLQTNYEDEELVDRYTDLVMGGIEAVAEGWRPQPETHEEQAVREREELKVEQAQGGGTVW